MSIAGWAGNIPDTLTSPAPAGTYVFAGPSTTVTTEDNQRVTGSAEAPMSLAMGGPVIVLYVFSIGLAWMFGKKKRLEAV